MAEINDILHFSASPRIPRRPVRVGQRLRRRDPGRAAKPPFRRGAISARSADTENHCRRQRFSNCSTTRTKGALLWLLQGQLLLQPVPQVQGQLFSLAERAALQREEQLPSQELEEKELTARSS